MTSLRRHRLTIVIAAIAAAGALLAPTGDTHAQGADADPIETDDPAVVSGLAWHLDATAARTAWRSSLGGGVVVAVVDSGVDADHPDLVGQVSESITCEGTDGDPSRCTGSGRDHNGHGTHVAGLVAARTDDGTGVAGVAPRATLLAIRAIDASCDSDECTPTGPTADVAAGIRWALDHDADVINVSVSASRRLGPELAAAVDEAWDAGAIPVIAAGNRSGTSGSFDARAALVVTATDRNGVLAPYASPVDGAPFGIAAPGGEQGDTAETCHIDGTPAGLISTVPTAAGDRSGYACRAGTSMAAPQVSAGLALLLSMGYSRDDAVERLLDTARPGHGLGAGSLDLPAAVAGPIPPGVRTRHDDFDNGTAPPDRAPPTTGPFAAPSGGSRDWQPWLVVALGGVAAGGAAEAVLRVRRRRQVGAPGGDATRPG